MANCRNQGQSQNHQVGHWRSSSSSYSSRKPPLDNWHSTVPSWEKKFCYSVGAVPWRKLIECKRYLYLHPNVVDWDDSAVKEAFDNAKKRFWAEINGLPCDISLPDSDIYIDDVDWNSSVDPALIMDLETEPKPLSEEGRDDEVVIVGGSLVLNNQVLTPTGWGDDDEAEAPKPSDPNSFAQGWDSNLHNENSGVNSWEQCYTPVQHEWQNYQNDSQGWNQREQHYGGELQNKARGRSGGNGNWGTTWDGGYNRKRENMSWSNNYNSSAAYHYGNEYQNQMNRGRRNYNRGGGRRGHFAYVDKVPTPNNAW